jgi:hypothetical protein
MSQKDPPEQLDAFEAALASLSLKPAGLSRDRVMFLAGRAAAQASSSRSRIATWLWPCATAASLLLAVALGGTLLLHGQPPSRDHEVAYNHTSPWAAELADSAQASADYLRLRHLVLAEGVEALAVPSPAPSSPVDIPRWTPGPIVDLETILGG